LSKLIYQPPARRAEWIIFFKSVHCLSGLGIVRKDRRIPKHFFGKRSLPASTGASSTIENLSCAFQPMAIEAKGILFKPLKPQRTFSIPEEGTAGKMAVAMDALDDAENIAGGAEKESIKE